MEEEIEEALKEYYNLNIVVKFKDFRKYEIIVKTNEKLINIDFTYNAKSTFDSNVTEIKRIIDFERRKEND